MDFKDRLRELREKIGISPSQLAVEFSKSESAIRMWETGRSKPDADTLIRLAAYFGTSTDYLLGLDNNKNKESLHMLDGKLQELGDILNEIAADNDAFIRSINVILGLPFSLVDMEIIDPNVKHQYFGYFKIMLSYMAHSAISLVEFVRQAKSRHTVSVGSYFRFASVLETEKRIAESALAIYYCQIANAGSHFAIENCDDSIVELIGDMSHAILKGANPDKIKQDLKVAIDDLGQYEIGSRYSSVNDAGAEAQDDTQTNS